ncbi:hypothetical protein P8452_22230 [Trifolium repens]|nr:Plant stearoyl-acyl-carrier-protein desaturase family protein [Trifolium repens]WJX34082.1 hypothetical protein P8452_22230 [Trifolium repens]
MGLKTKLVQAAIHGLHGHDLGRPRIKDMVEKTIQYLIGAGMDIPTGNDPYKAFVYTSFQERATFCHTATSWLD